MYQINKTIILLFTSFVYNISFGQDISLSQLGIPPNTCDTLCSVRFLQNKKITIEYDSITKQGVIVNIYDKGNYNMLLVRYKGKKGEIYHSCSNQMKDTHLIF